MRSLFVIKPKSVVNKLVENKVLEVVQRLDEWGLKESRTCEVGQEGVIGDNGFHEGGGPYQGELFNSTYPK